MNMKDMDIEENDSSRYEIWYNHIYDYISSHNALKNIILFAYKVLPYFVAVSYIVLIVMCLRTKGAIVTPTLSFSVDATGYVETSNLFVTSKLILTPLTSFIVVSFFRKCIDAQRSYVKYNITPLVNKDKEGESMPSRHVFSITIIAMCWFYIYQPVGIVLFVLTAVLAVLRVITGVHFIRDVVAGIVVGVLCGFVGLWIL